jgi:MFS superfamily sulfate permease-like transporter
MSVNADPPASAWSWNVLGGDVFGGVAAGVVALPLALAFGAASGLGPVAGLYGAIATGIVAALFGGTPVQITGPTGPMTLVVAGIVATNTLPSGAVNLPIIVAIIVLTGLFQIALGLFRIGAYIRYVPYPVISGFMSGIGVIAGRAIATMIHYSGYNDILRIYMTTQHDGVIITWHISELTSRMVSTKISIQPICMRCSSADIKRVALAQGTTDP